MSLDLGGIEIPHVLQSWVEPIFESLENIETDFVESYNIDL
jgi:hypothetical protein